ncbi:MAG: penicillin-binding protein 2 [Marinicaulis sp.]|nr:penicillin-binding protein 2 [Marinicaulis sp.]
MRLLWRRLPMPTSWISSALRRGRARTRPVAYVVAESEMCEESPALQVRANRGQSRHMMRSRMRVMMCAVVFSFVFASLGLRLAYISFGDAHIAERYHTTKLADAERPEIIDRNGAILATDLPMIALEVAGRDVWDAKETAEALGNVLSDIDVTTLEEKIAGGRYVEVRADLTPAERKAVFDLGLPGVRFAARTKRFYPQGALGAHVVGHEEPGKGGVMGLEKTSNTWRSDGPLRASIDVRIQQIVEDELSASMEKFSAKAAWAAIMDVETGEVISLVSLPDFDPNAPGAAPADSRRNRATYDRYELGSAFKAFTAAAALDAGIAEETTTYDARKPFRVADRRITDFHGENRVLSLSEVVQYSSNIGIAQIATDLGPEKQKAYLKSLGLFDALPIELNENRNVELPYQWGPVEAATIAYGHGISVTPLHLLSGFSAVVNGGEYRRPTFLAGEIPPSARVFNEETSATMRRILRRVVTDGTAQYAEAADYFPIGKTATADKPVAGGYDRNTRIASFVGAFPGYAPKYAVLVSLDEPQPLPETYGYATAGWNAAPAFSRIVERSAPVLGLRPVNEAAALQAFVSGYYEGSREALLQHSSIERVQ